MKSVFAFHAVIRPLLRPRPEHREALEVAEEREGDLSANVGDLQLPHDEAEAFDGPGAARPAVSHEPRRLVVPLGVEVVDGVLERARGAMVVLGVTKT